MSDLKARFEQAVATSKTLSGRPDNLTLLKIYAYYKQATEGDNPAPKPGFTDIVARAKWEAWTKLKGRGQDDVMQKYVELISELRGS